MNFNGAGEHMSPPVQYIDRQVNPLEMPPEVSIILPAYNAHNTIKRTIASICMQQDIDEIEIIIADDCSDEPYDKIAQQFAHMVRIKVVRMLKNGGPGAARQIGFDYSVGKYIMWMDADDTLVSADTILTLKNVMIQKEMDCVYGKFLEQNEDGSIYPHELHMVWMFGKLYRRSFLEKYDIRFNTSLSNEDTGFNCLVKACSDKIWYIPKDVYIWQFKPNSITRIKQGMYGQDSGYKGYLDNMVWQILESQKRFVNKNYILNEIVSVMCVLYHFHVENMQNCPMNKDASMNWIRGYYDLVYKPYEDVITPDMFNRVFAQVAAGQNIAGKGIIPRMTIYEFMDEVKAKPYTNNPEDEVRGSTPAGYVPPITSKDWPVEIHEYINQVEGMYKVDSDTNFSRYTGMKKMLGQELTDKDYDIHYNGASDNKSANLKVYTGEAAKVGNKTIDKTYTGTEGAMGLYDPANAPYAGSLAYDINKQSTAEVISTNVKEQSAYNPQIKATTEEPLMSTCCSSDSCSSCDGGCKDESTPAVEVATNISSKFPPYKA